MKIIVTKRKSKEVLLGQIYKMVDQDRYFMVVGFYKAYSLIELSDGGSWDVPVENINDVFSDLREDFTLLENAELNIIV